MEKEIIKVDDKYVLVVTKDFDKWEIEMKKEEDYIPEFPWRDINEGYIKEVGKSNLFIQMCGSDIFVLLSRSNVQLPPYQTQYKRSRQISQVGMHRARLALGSATA